MHCCLFRNDKVCVSYKTKRFPNAMHLQLREFFANKLDKCGGDACIESIRVIRDKETFQGKGFGYLLLTVRNASLLFYF